MRTGDTTGAFFGFRDTNFHTLFVGIESSIILMEEKLALEIERQKCKKASAYCCSILIAKDRKQPKCQSRVTG